MTSSATSTEGGRHWSSYVLGKIRSLWSAGTSSVGLNQLVSGTDLNYSFCVSILQHGFIFNMHDFNYKQTKVAPCVLCLCSRNTYNKRKY